MGQAALLQLTHRWLGRSTVSAQEASEKAGIYQGTAPPRRAPTFWGECQSRDRDHEPC